jgi:septal ring factor EnvC (AmiA/AmiB activator)
VSLILRVLALFGLPSWMAPLFIAFFMATVVSGAYVKGRLDSASGCRERELQAKIAAMERDIRIASQAETRAKDQIKRLEAEAKQHDEQVNEYEEELRKRPDRCDLTPADVNRLRGNRGR